MIPALTLLLSCQLIGEVVARGLKIPVPGPVLGLVLLFLLLLLRKAMRPQAADIGETPLGRTTRGLLAHLSILFVPAGVGIVGHAAAVSEHGLPLVAALIGSTALALVVTALVFNALSDREDAA
jgi:holin-like protein